MGGGSAATPLAALATTVMATVIPCLSPTSGPIVCLTGVAASVAVFSSTAAPVAAQEKPAGPEKPAEKGSREVVLAEGKLVVTAPEAWVRKQPRSRIVEHEFSVPPVGGETVDGRFTVMGAGGGVEANIDRWVGQFSQPDGSSTKEKTKVQKMQVNGIEVHYVDIPGTFKDQAGPFAPAQVRDNFRLLGAIIVTEKSGMHFLKLTGPKATMAAQEEPFKAMINSLKAK
jgi:hypothetical protein